ncbi:hypothetical protein FRIGORI9N_400105 [Frigoribacterium sp. 9N]|nr:hypothetical protein FRIGORI9N_400105 [Frigoribacterium sp. 9N]
MQLAEVPQPSISQSRAQGWG